MPKKPSAARISRAPSVAVDVAKEDISLILAKLNLGIDDVAKQLKALVGTFCVWAGTVLSRFNE